MGEGISKNNKRVMRAWAFYDWANSVYSLVITSTIFPIYYSIVTTRMDGAGNPLRNMVRFFGRDYQPDAVYGYSLTISFLIVVFLSPFLSALADTIGNKKLFMQIFCYIGSFSCMGLAFFTGMHTLWLGLIFSVMASTGYWGSIVFYNSFLPDIATPDKQDHLSAQGFIYGYIGSVVLVLICFGLIMGLAKTDEQAMTMMRVSFLLTGVWWLAFAQYTFRNLPKFGQVAPSQEKRDRLKKRTGDGEQDSFLRRYRRIALDSFRELYHAGKHLFQSGNLKFFLLGFFFYSIGMQTIFLMSTLFGSSEIHLSEDKLIITLLVIQIEAIFGAMFFSWLSKRIGNKNVISIAVFIWILVCLGAYLMDSNDPNVEYHFYLLAAVVGLVMGGLQAMSRSTYSKLLPQDSGEATTYFSFYDVLEKIAIVVGTFVFASLIEYFHNMRFSALAMGIFFVVGFVFIRGLQSDRPQRTNP